MSANTTIKVWDIPGGVHPPENKTQSTQLPIGSIALPKEVILPLNQHIGAPAIPVVNVGDKVLKGQLIADTQGLVSVPVHASTSGTVVAIEDRPIPHASGMNAPCIVIGADGEDRWIELQPCEDYEALSPKDLSDKIRSAGIAGMGGAGFPTQVKLNPRASYDINTLILNGTECEPYITADDRLMRERADELVAGTLLLAHILKQPDNLIIGIEDNKPEAIAAVEKAAAGTRIQVVTFPTKYPSGGEKQLIQILTGKEVPSGGLPAELGIVMQNTGTAVAAWRAVRYGEPLVSRVTTVVGRSLKTQRNIDVLLGTPLQHILDEHGFDADNCRRLIIGGPMMGFAVERTDVPVIKTTNCILAPALDELPAQPPAQPCIRCGMCAEACPASLLPQQLFWFAQSEDVEKLQSHNLFDCIECGACAYVCPSNIPLVQYYRASKGIIRQIESDKQKSDRSRERFEARKARLERAEAEKEAKRQARKKAAEEAKRKLAEQKKAGTTESTDTANVDAAKTQQKIDDPAIQQGKLERAVSSAQSRVDRARKQLHDAGEENDPSRIETLASRLKQAELKLSEAQGKLEAFKQGEQPAGASAIKEKISLSPIEKQEKNIASIKNRLHTAEEKYSEAEQRELDTTDALRQGVEKLRAKLQQAEQDLAALKTDGGEQATKNHDDEKTQNAAEVAIEKAKAKAAAMASMSDEEKAKAQIESLKQRLEKAKTRLAKAEEENNEHIEAFRSSVEKLAQKLKEAET